MTRRKTTPDEAPGDDARDEFFSDADGNADNGDQRDVHAELAQEKDRVLRLQAELENTRTRLRREMADERQYANVPLVRDLLPVMDNIDRAIEAAEQKHDVESLLQGVKLMRQQLESVLAAHHCQPIDAAGEPFDPHLHEAILQQPSADLAPGTVLQVTQTGYQIHDRVVRPSQVIVSAAPPDENE